MRWFLNIEPKSFEISYKSRKGNVIFSIMERGKGRLRVVSFDSQLCEKLCVFLKSASRVQSEEAVKETLRSPISTIFLSRQSNDWGLFVRLMEWNSSSRNRFIAIHGDAEFA